MKGVTREGALIPSLWGHPLYEYLSNLSPEPLPSEPTKSSEASDVGRQVGDHDPSRAAPECGQAPPRGRTDPPVEAFEGASIAEPGRAPRSATLGSSPARPHEVSD